MWQKMHVAKDFYTWSLNDDLGEADAWLAGDTDKAIDGFVITVRSLATHREKRESL